MTEVWTLVAIFGPWTMGTAICRRRGGSGFAAFARGWFVGLALVMFASPVLLNLLGAGAIKWVALIMLASGIAMARPLFSEIGEELRTRGKHYVDPITLAWRRLTLPKKSVLVVLLFMTFIMVFSKIMIGAIALAWIPARCEDALAYWLFKAKVITLLGHVQLNASDPFYLGGSNPNYPIYPSMIAAWIPLAVGQWSETLSVLPWFLTFINLPLAAATGLPCETPRLIQIAIAYVLLSLPLALIHVFRPGYVDLILASFLMCGVSLILEWRNLQRMGTLIIATFLFVAAACTKREGVVAVAAVLGVFFAFLVAERVRERTSAKPLGALLIAGSSSGAAIWFLMNHSDLSNDASKWGYHPEAWAALWRHAFEWSSFSLFFPFALAGIAGILILRRSANGYLATALCLALFAYAASPFLLTDNVRFALNDQTPSRLLLHIVPAMAVALADGHTRGRTCLEPTN